MSNSPGQRPQFDLRDLNPRTSTPSRSGASEYRARRARGEAAARGAHGAGEIQTLEYVGPVGELLHRVKSANDPSKTTVVPTTSPGQTYVPGSRVAVLSTRSGVEIIGGPPGGERGINATTAREVSGDFSVFDLQSMAPESLTGGTTTAVTLTGAGFRETPLDVLEAVVYAPTDGSADADGYIADPDVGLANLAYVSSTSMTVDITVSFGLPSDRALTLRLTRG